MPSAPSTARAGLGIALPERVVTNEEVGARIGRDPAWIESRTGIVERRWAAPDQTLADLAAAAGAEDPAAAATMLTVLLDGALSDAALDPADDPARRAREAAALLVDRLLPTS